MYFSFNNLKFHTNCENRDFLYVNLKLHTKCLIRWKWIKNLWFHTKCAILDDLYEIRDFFAKFGRLHTIWLKRPYSNCVEFLVPQNFGCDNEYLFADNKNNGDFSARVRYFWTFFLKIYSGWFANDVNSCVGGNVHLSISPI